MNRKWLRAVLSALILSGLAAAGCSKGEPELKVDPAMANKPFPKAGGRQQVP